MNDAVKMSVRPRIYGSGSDTFVLNGRHRAVGSTTATAAAAATEGAGTAVRRLYSLSSSGMM